MLGEGGGGREQTRVLTVCLEVLPESLNGGQSWLRSLIFYEQGHVRWLRSLIFCVGCAVIPLWRFALGESKSKHWVLFIVWVERPIDG